MSAFEATTPEGALRPARLLLDEGSGPVSPRYQYSIHLLLQVAPDAITLERKIRGGAASGVGAERDDRVPVSAERYLQLARELQACGPQAFAADLVGPAEPRRVGVSFNHFEVRVDDTNVCAVDYLLSRLELPENAGVRKAIDAFKKLGLEL
jgi:hypothetical protein